MKLFPYEITWKGYVAAETREKAESWLLLNADSVGNSDAPAGFVVSEETKTVDEEWAYCIPWGNVNTGSKTCKEILEENNEEKIL